MYLQCNIRTYAFSLNAGKQYEISGKGESEKSVRARGYAARNQAIAAVWSSIMVNKGEGKRRGV